MSLFKGIFYQLLKSEKLFSAFPQTYKLLANLCSLEMTIEDPPTFDLMKGAIIVKADITIVRAELNLRIQRLEQ